MAPTYKRRRQEDSESDTVSLLGQFSRAQTRSMTKKRKTIGPVERRDRATTGEIRVGPSGGGQSRITLRLRPRQHEEAWWASSKMLEQQRDERKQEQSEAAAKEESREAWLGRLRRTPARLARSQQAGKESA